MSYDRYRRECVATGDPNVVIFFDRLIEEGNNPGFAAMLALQSPPGTKGTDRAFLEGSHEWAERIAPINRSFIFEQAKKHGIPTAGKVYKAGLGKPSDPLAWVSDTSDVLKAAKIKGKTVEGAVKYTPPAPSQPRQQVRLAEDLCRKMEQRYLTADPGLAEKVKKSKKARRELREKVIEKHGAKKRSD